MSAAGQARRPKRARRRRALRGVVFWAGWWVLAMGLWLALTSTVDPLEAVVGAGASALAATVAEAVRSRGPARFRPRLRWVRLAPRVAAGIVTDTVIVFVAVWRHVAGRKEVRGGYRVIPFRHGDPTDPRQAARRAVATAGLSMTPNTYVIGVDADRDVLLVHQLVQAPGAVERLLGRL